MWGCRESGDAVHGLWREVYRRRSDTKEVLGPWDNGQIVDKRDG